jgi:Tol biopolymer transport system component
VRTTLLLCATTALVVAGFARSAAPPVVPHDFQPWWAPQGTTIAFQRLMPVTGGTDVFFTPVVRGKEVDLFGTGTLRGFRPGSGDVLVDTGDTTVVRDSTDRTLGSVPGTDATWSPNGSQIAYLENSALMVAAASGASPQELATGIVPPGTDVSGPVWSPDGMSIAIASASGDGSAIEIVQLDGTVPHVAYDGPGDNVNPSWSHDGTSIAFDSNQGQGWSIWIVAPDGTNAHEAISTGGNNRYPQWSPDDNRLAFLSDRAGGYGLYVGTPDGTQQEVINDVSPESPARWSPNGTLIAVSSAHDCGRFGVYVVSSTAPFKPVRRSNQCRIDGTPGDDTIQGTPYPDVIYGNGGNDAIFSHGGNDVIYGGAGNDAIGGGPGNDIIYGGPGNDVLSGSTGNDTIYAGPGHDKIGCGPGSDTAYINPGDTVRGCEHVHKS